MPAYCNQFCSIPLNYINQTVRILAVCSCGVPFTDPERGFSGWPHYTRISSTFFCSACQHSLAYELIEPYHWSSLFRKGLVTPAQLILELTGQKVLAGVVAAVGEAIASVEDDAPEQSGSASLTPPSNSGGSTVTQTPVIPKATVKPSATTTNTVPATSAPASQSTVIESVSVIANDFNTVLQDMEKLSADLKLAKP